MAQLSKAEITRLARLARLRLTAEEAEAFLKELSAILGYVEKLRAVKTEGAEPTAQVTGLTNVMRPDEPADYGASAADLLQNVPARQKGYIKVKRILT